MTDSDEALRLVVRGRVQGVFFRDSCRQKASALGVRGWVRNREDGAVEAVVAGPPDALEEMVRWAQQGPPRASVETVEAMPTDDPGRTGFEVR
ncbi:MAG: acylphosphatase [Actinomycetota bacterium]|nr:acylphosphatase [Actinomycetota bacterium]